MIDTHNKLITIGPHKGQRWTRLPLPYLRWLANEKKGHMKEMAESELERRGSTPGGNVEISGHAIDRASLLTSRSDWGKDGLHSWLYKKAEIAYTFTTQHKGDERVEYGKYCYVFKHGNYYPVLVTFTTKTPCNSSTIKPRA